VSNCYEILPELGCVVQRFRHYHTIKKLLVPATIWLKYCLLGIFSNDHSTTQIRI